MRHGTDTVHPAAGRSQLRQPKPWFWDRRKAWYLTLHGKQIRLGSDRRRPTLNSIGSWPPRGGSTIDRLRG